VPSIRQDLHVNTYVYMYVCVYVAVPSIRQDVYVNTYVYMYVCVYVAVPSIRQDVYVNRYVYMYVCIHVAVPSKKTRHTCTGRAVRRSRRERTYMYIYTLSH